MSERPPSISPARKEPEADVNPEDSLLIERAQQDPMAFAELYRRHHARVYNYLRLRTLTAEEAADLTHEVFFKALDALPRYRTRGPSAQPGQLG